jgi:hypothetical protein
MRHDAKSQERIYLLEWKKKRCTASRISQTHFPTVVLTDLLRQNGHGVYCSGSENVAMTEFQGVDNIKV